MVAMLFSLGGSVLVAQMYGAGMVGILAMVQAFLMFASIFTLLGTSTAILRLIPEHISKYSFSSAFRVYRKTLYLVSGCSLLISGALIAGASFVAETLFGKPNLEFYFALAAGFVIFKALTELNTQALRGMRLIRTFAAMQAIPHGTMLLLLLLALLFWDHPDAPVFAQLGALVLTSVVGLSIMTYTFKRKINPQDNVQDLPIRDLLRISTPMLLTASMNFFAAQIGLILLGVFHTEGEVGGYAIAVQLASLTTFILHSINSMTAPKFAELYHLGKMDDLFLVAHRSARLIFWTATPILVILLIFGDPILVYFFGEEFRAAYSALVVLVLGQFVNAASGSTAIFMNMSGNQRVFSYIIAVSASSNFIMCLIFIPMLGGLGAAVSFSVSLIVWNIITLCYIKWRYGRAFGYLPIPKISF